MRKFNQHDLNEYEMNILANADYFTLVRFAGRGKFITEKFTSLNVLKSFADQYTHNYMVYACTNEGRDAPIGDYS
tara:strand:+ start:1206 stop:1430 length:225 start_codon:yes stop_codon:yes gene_type:complete